MHQIRTLRQDDVKHVVCHASTDSLEALRLIGATDLEATVQALAHASFLARTIEQHGMALAIFGFVKTADSSATVWLLAIDKLPALPMSLVEQARDYLQVVAKTHPYITTAVREKNIDHLRWVQWLGFKEIRKMEFSGEIFLNFVLGETNGV